jgi:protein-tyrosine phosphatase
MKKKPASILFVCTGNICRSPTAEALFRHAVRTRGLDAHFTHDSAGVASHHIGHAPDERSQRATLKRGIDMSDLRARDVRPSDFYAFDLILAMDASHLKVLKAKAPDDATAEIALHLPYTGHSDGDVPDPYYGETADFEHVYALLDAANDALLQKLLS